RVGREKLADDAKEVVEAIVMQPVPGTLDADDASVAEMASASVFGRISRAALLAIQQERGARDPLPEQLDVAAAHVGRRPRRHGDGELPSVRPDLVLVDPVYCQVPRLLSRQVRVLLLHAPEGLLDRGVAAGKPPGEVALLADPFFHALDDRLRG